MALRLLAKIEKQADENFSAAAWILERRFGENFARPEIQCNMLAQNNVTDNHLTIVISAEEAKQLNAEGEECREKVRTMLEDYQLGRSNGNQNANGSVSLEVQEKFANYRPPSGNGA